MYANQTTCPGCEASITDTNDVEFIQIDTADGFDSLTRAPKIMYVIACGSCEAILGGGVGAWTGD